MNHHRSKADRALAAYLALRTDLRQAFRLKVAGIRPGFRIVDWDRSFPGTTVPVWESCDEAIIRLSSEMDVIAHRYPSLGLNPVADLSAAQDIASLPWAFQFPATPAAGSRFYRNDQHVLYVFTDGQWLAEDP